MAPSCDGYCAIAVGTFRLVTLETGCSSAFDSGCSRALGTRRSSTLGSYCSLGQIPAHTSIRNERAVMLHLRVSADTMARAAGSRGALDLSQGQHVVRRRWSPLRIRWVLTFVSTGRLPIPLTITPDPRHQHPHRIERDGSPDTIVSAGVSTCPWSPRGAPALPCARTRASPALARSVRL